MPFVNEESFHWKIISYNIDKIIYKYIHKDKKYSAIMSELAKNTKHIELSLSGRDQWHRHYSDITRKFKITRSTHIFPDEWFIIRTH
jgi:hypothetical protein